RLEFPVDSPLAHGRRRAAERPAADGARRERQSTARHRNARSVEGARKTEPPSGVSAVRQYVRGSTPVRAPCHPEMGDRCVRVPGASIVTFRAFGELVAFGATTDGGRAADFVRDCWSRSSGDMATPECYPW